MQVPGSTTQRYSNVLFLLGMTYKAISCGESDFLQGYDVNASQENKSVKTVVAQRNVRPVLSAIWLHKDDRR